MKSLIKKLFSLGTLLLLIDLSLAFGQENPPQ